MGTSRIWLIFGRNVKIHGPSIKPISGFFDIRNEKVSKSIFDDYGMRLRYIFWLVFLGS